MYVAAAALHPATFGMTREYSFWTTAAMNYVVAQALALQPAAERAGDVTTPLTDGDAIMLASTAVPPMDAAYHTYYIWAK